MGNWQSSKYDPDTQYYYGKPWWFLGRPPYKPPESARKGEINMKEVELKYKTYFDALEQLPLVKDTLAKVNEIYSTAVLYEKAATHQLTKYPAPVSMDKVKSYKKETMPDGTVKVTLETACGNIVKEYKKLIKKIKDDTKDDDIPDLTEKLALLTADTMNIMVQLTETRNLIAGELVKLQQKLQRIADQKSEMYSIMLFELREDHKRNATIGTQNSAIEQKIKKFKEVFLLDNQKVMYENKQIDSLQNINFFMFWVYWGLVFGLIMTFLFLSDMNYIIKIIAVIIAIAYPFSMYYIEKYVYFSYMYMKSIIKGDAYVR
jgi:hypothetical protein